MVIVVGSSDYRHRLYFVRVDWFRNRSFSTLIRCDAAGHVVFVVMFATGRRIVVVTAVGGKKFINGSPTLSMIVIVDCIMQGHYNVTTIGARVQ